MLWLKQSTAVTVKIGPFVDSGDGNSVEDALTLTQGDIRLSKNGGDIAQKNESSSCSHDELGYYDCALDVTDTGTLGRLQLFVHESGALPVWHEFMVVPANMYDSLVGGTDYLQTDVTEISSDSGAADNAELAFDGNGYGFTGCTMPTVTTLTGHTAQTGDNYARLGAPAGASVSADIVAVKTDTGNIETDTQDIQSRLPAALVGGRMDSDAVAISGSTTAADNVEANIGNLDAAISGLNDPTAAAVADAVWDELETGHTDAGKAGAKVWTDIPAILTDTAEIGAAGAGLTEAGGTGDQLSAIPWNSAWDAEVESEVDDALGVGGADLTAIPWNSAWDTEVESEVDDALGVGGADLTAIPWNSAWDAEVESEVDDALATYDAVQPADLPANFADLSITASTGRVDVASIEGSDATDQIGDAALDEVVESTYTLRQIMRIFLAGVAGKTTGGGTTTRTFRDVADAKARITATVDSNENRTAVTLDGS